MPYFFGGVVGLALTVFWIYSILDVISTDSLVCRNLPKPLWVFVVLFFPTVGALAWWIVGRPERASLSLGGKPKPRRPKPLTAAPRGIEDMPDWPKKADEMLKNRPNKDEIRRAADERSKKLREWEAGLIKREKALDDERRRREEEKGE